jgi:hypothetical protein
MQAFTAFLIGLRGADALITGAMASYLGAILASNLERSLLLAPAAAS